jgi:hypothetical protein
MRKHGVWSTGKHCSHKACLPRQRRVTDRKSTLMHTIEAANLDSATHRSIPKAELPKLPDRDNPVLFFRVLADQCIYRVNRPPTGRIRSICVRFRPVGGGLGVVAARHEATLAGRDARVVR